MSLTQQRADVKRLRECQLSISLEGVADRYHKLILAFEERQTQLPVSISKRTQAVLRDATGEGGMGLYRCNKSEYRYRPNKGDGNLPKRPHRRKRWVCGPKRPVKGE